MRLITSSTLNDALNRRHDSSYVRDAWPFTRSYGVEANLHH
jgi:hypothetical protein